MTNVDRDRLQSLIGRERTTYAAAHPRSQAAAAGGGSLIGGVPMTWMAMWTGGFPLQLATAQGNRLTDLDGHSYVDFCLGDTGAMAGHSPEPTVRAIRRRIEELGGITTMLPTEDAGWVGDELARRFGLPQWSFSLTATDANRWAIRIARHLTGRSKILVYNHCYHGSVDETVVELAPDGSVIARPGNVGAPVDLALTTRCVEFNDLAALERELAFGDVAVVLAEPALTNIGIVLPDPGYHQALRELTRRYGTLLAIDETHTFSAGPGGCTKAWGLDPDIVTIGKAIAGGVPAGAYGLTAELAERILGQRNADLVDVGGVGGTLAGNALSTAAMRATLGEVLTDAAFPAMIALAEAFTAGVQDVIDRSGLPWSVTRLGARAEYRFCSPEPRNGGESAAANDEELNEFLHLYTVNRGILMTPFHNMALMCPATTAADVVLHTAVFGDAVAELVG
ncbi:MAG: glutamate-semialdehyde -aminomutase [Frankiales bacterium]|jgi:glutamate-1-semialdehyde 2,1-aminomutase|nr:glutamate-semialdehyde -aminomutase [Frankiales bacterium]MDX6246535.1 glutamate-semialdehyde -aminomutase [Frankiales bacterium]